MGHFAIKAFDTKIFISDVGICQGFSSALYFKWKKHNSSQWKKGNIQNFMNISKNLCQMLLKYSTDICIKIFPDNIHKIGMFKRFY